MLTGLQIPLLALMSTQFYILEAGPPLKGTCIILGVGVLVLFAHSLFLRHISEMFSKFSPYLSQVHCMELIFMLTTSLQSQH